MIESGFYGKQAITNFISDAQDLFYTFISRCNTAHIDGKFHLKATLSPQMLSIRFYNWNGLQKWLILVHFQLIHSIQGVCGVEKYDPKIIIDNS